MKVFTASLLAVALAGVSASAAAQFQTVEHPYGDAPYGNYEYRNRGVEQDVYRDGDRDAYRDPYRDPARDAYGQGAHYDWARVVRVDPVLVQGRGYPTRDDRRCRTQRDDYATHDPYRDRHDPYGRNDPYRDPYARDPYARDPYQRDPYQHDPYRDARRDENGRMVATVLGGIAGAVLGSKVGDGSGRYIGTAVGSMVGGMAGRGIYDSNRRARDARDGYVTVCDPEPYAGSYPGGYAGDRAVSEYDVTYEYAGRHYTTRTDYHPGDRIRVRVDVRPE